MGDGGHEDVARRDPGATDSAWAPQAPRTGGETLDLGLTGYTDLVEVARGGDSVVYRARQLSPRRDVAIKVIDVADAETLARFERELEITVMLGRQHPHIITVLDTSTTADGRACLVMDFHDLGSLHDRLRSHGPLPVSEVVAAGTAVADALAFAHSHGVLHRDVKPQNVLLLPTSYVLTDFGIARHADSGRTASLERFSYRHASPQVLDGLEPTVADDVWSLGSTLSTLLEGRAPFAADDPDDDSALAYLRRVRTGQRRPLRREDVPDDVAALVDRCLAPDPTERYASAADVHDALRAVRTESRAWAPGTANTAGAADTARSPATGTTAGSPATGTTAGMSRGTAAATSHATAVGTRHGTTERASGGSAADQGGAERSGAVTHDDDGAMPSGGVDELPSPDRSTVDGGPAPGPGSGGGPSPAPERSPAPRTHARHAPSALADAAWAPPTDTPHDADAEATGLAPAGGGPGATSARPGLPDPEDRTPPGRRRRWPALVGFVAGAVLLGSGIGTAAVVLANRSQPGPVAPSGPTALPVPTVGEHVDIPEEDPLEVDLSDPAYAPADVVLVDNGTSITASWTDPTEGRITVAVVDATDAEDPVALESIAPGVTTRTVEGIDPDRNSVCLLLVGIDVSDATRWGASEISCVQR